MMEKTQCGSCGVPFTPEGCGSNRDGSMSLDYCEGCFKRGQFTEPELTMAGMIKASAAHMIEQLGFSKGRAMQMSHSTIPALKRWKAKR